MTRIGETKTVKQWTMMQLFTLDELKKAWAIFESASGRERHARLVKEVCEPAIERINKVTGQENLPEYLAYALEYACSAS